MQVSRRFILAVLASVALARSARAADPSVKGPFDVGFTSFTVTDTAQRLPTPTAPRPVAVSMFYPVDPRRVGPTTPVAAYPWRPAVAPGDVFPASAVAAHDLDLAYQEPAPSSSAPFPLLLLSPGGGQPWWYSIGLAARVATHGFVVGVVSAWGDGAQGEPGVHAGLRLFHRPRDLSFALEAILARHPGLVEPARVAAGGHSLGGYAALALAAGDDDVCDHLGPNAGTPPPALVRPDEPGRCYGSAPDPRFRALLLLDASSQQLSWDELARVTIPSMGIGEDWESVIANFGAPSAAWHAREHAALNGQPTYRVDVERTLHVPSFTSACQLFEVRCDLGILGPVQCADQLKRLSCNASPLLVLPYATANQIEWKYAVAFLRQALAGERGVGGLLTPGWAIAREPDVQFFVTEPRAGIDPGVDLAPPEGEFWYFATQPGTLAHAAKDTTAPTPDLSDAPGDDPP